MIPAAWNTHELSHRYSGNNLYFIHVIEGHPNYVRLADAVKEFPMSKHEKQQVAELRDRIAKGEDCVKNGFVVAKGGKA